MDEFVGALAAQQAELRTLLAGLDEREWHLPSRCEGWDVADVVLHVAQTNDMARASAEGRFEEHLAEVGRAVGWAADVDDGAAKMVERERGATGPEVGARYAAGADALREVLAAGDPHARVQWVAGELALRTLTITRLAETWIHTGDVAHALGVELEPGERLRHIARLAWRTLPYAFSRAGSTMSGPVTFELTAPSGEPWTFAPSDGDRDALAPATTTTIRGDALELCLVAARRVDPHDTGLFARSTGPDVAPVLALVRTYA